MIGSKPNKKIINLEYHPDYQENKELFDDNLNGTYSIARYLHMYDKSVEAVRFQRPWYTDDLRAPCHYFMAYIHRLVRIDFETTDGNREVELGITSGSAIYIKKIKSGETLDLPELRVKENGGNPVAYYLKKAQVKNPIATVINYVDSPKKDSYKDFSLEDLGFVKYGAGVAIGF